MIGIFSQQNNQPHEDASLLGVKQFENFAITEL
jgi:hypothetical protein